MKKTKTKLVLALGLTPALQRTMVFKDFIPGDVNRAREVIVTASGKNVNLGLALASLGEQVCIAGFNGGATGRAVTADVLRRGGIPAFTAIKSETRTCTTVINEKNGVVTELVQEGPAVTDVDLERMTRKVFRLLPRCSIMSISGNLPKTYPNDAYVAFTRRAHELDIPWIIDSHKEPLLATLTSAPLLVKLNKFELGKTFGFESPDDDTCVELLGRLTSKGAEWALMTNGAGTALLLSREGGLFRLEPKRLDHVINPVGSGDCAGAGIIHGFLNGMDMPDAVAFGLACGTANAASRIPGDFVIPCEA